MGECPDCESQQNKPAKTWKYGQFTVRAFLCNSCGTKFSEYVKNGKLSFKLKLEKGKGFVKA